MLSKEYLYEPMKEISEKYPEWMEKNKDKHSEAEMKQYGMQHKCFIRICEAFDEDPENNSKVMELMTEMQMYGQPPAELVEDMGGEGLPGMGGMPGMGGAGAPSEKDLAEIQKMAEGCPMQ